nr:NACHT domain-containing protein [Candidatus Electrothrix aestuarii]
MEWLDWITAGVRWLKENPEVTWSGAGFTILGVFYFVVKISLTVIIRRVRGKPPLSPQSDTSEWQAKSQLHREQHTNFYSFPPIQASQDINKTNSLQHVGRSSFVQERIGMLDVFIRRLTGHTVPLTTQHTKKWLPKNRHKLLTRLQWELNERINSLLLGQTTLHLDKDLSPYEVERPHTRQDIIDYTLERDGAVVESTDQPIVELFLRPDVGQRLAILGRPGSGKTVCLLKLLEHLLQQAEGDAHEPLPIIFECSEWDGRELVPWMAYQLHRKYEIKEETARQMVQNRDILPLFDGLDELATEKQGDFVRCFNALPNDRPQVVCCRIKEYEYLQENAGDKLALRNAVILRDITRQRLKGHLLRAGLHDLWTLLEQSENEADPSSPKPAEEGRDREQAQTLLDLARRPLFLGIMISVAEKLRRNRSLPSFHTKKELDKKE